MPFSDNRLRPKVLGYLSAQKFSPRTVLDVGAGGGANLEFYQPWWPNSHWTALEVWPPNIERFQLGYRYDNTIINDVRNITDFYYELVIFGDILEHLPKEDSLDVLNRALDHAAYVVVALPVIHYPQGAMDGNPYEEHVSEWTWDDFGYRKDCVFSVRNDVTGSFILKGGFGK